jgi:hypothetical protein
MIARVTIEHPRACLAHMDRGGSCLCGYDAIERAWWAARDAVLRAPYRTTAREAFGSRGQG